MAIEHDVVLAVSLNFNSELVITNYEEDYWYSSFFFCKFNSSVFCFLMVLFGIAI